MKKYLIDGNNLIGKAKSLWEIQQKDKQLSRIKLVKMLDQYFSSKSVKVSVHFDGFQNDPIPSSKIKIYYSNNKTADSEIKSEIDRSKNPKLIIVVSSDHSVQNYARVNSCEVIKSEDFSKQMNSSKNKSNEQSLINSIDENEIKKMFGVE